MSPLPGGCAPQAPGQVPVTMGGDRMEATDIDLCDPGNFVGGVPQAETEKENPLGGYRPNFVGNFF